MEFLERKTPEATRAQSDLLPHLPSRLCTGLWLLLSALKITCVVGAVSAAVPECRELLVNIM